MVLRDLEKATALQTDPVGVLLDLEVKRLPVISFLKVEFLNQVGSLPAIESSHYVQSFVVEG